MTHPIQSLMSEAATKAGRAERKIADAMREIADAERERDQARIEIAAYERALRAIGAQSELDLTNEAAVAMIKVKRVRAAKSASPQIAWVPVFQTLHKRHRDGFGYDEIAAVAGELGVEFRRPSLRTKMMNYVNAGAMERVGNGMFRLTEQGRSVFQIDASSNENGEAEASPDADEVTASSDQ